MSDLRERLTAATNSPGFALRRDRARCIRITALQFAGQVETSADGLVEAAAKIEAFIRNGKTEATPTSN